MWFGLCLPVYATTFTETVPNGNGPIPDTYPPVGGTMFVLIGVNGNIYYQFVNPSTQFRGFAGTGTPAAFRGIPTFQLGPQQNLNCGIVSCSDYFGGGIAEGYARLTVRDADACPGNFDFDDVSFEVNGLPVSSLSNLPANSVERTNFAGTTTIGTENCFRNQGSTETSTSWLDLPQNVLDNILTVGSTTPFITDTDTGANTTRGDNFWFFTDGEDATGTPEVAPGVEITKTADVTEYDAVGDIINYSFVVRNIGSVQLNSVVVSDSFITGTVNCPTNSLASGDSMTCTGQHIVTQDNIDDDIVFVNTAEVTANPTEGALGAVSGTLTIPGPDADNSATITKVASQDSNLNVGDTVTYTYVVENTGNITLNNVTIDDTHGGSGNLSAVSPAPVSLAPNESQTFTTTYEITQDDFDAGQVDNTAIIDATPARGSFTSPSADEQVTMATPTPEATFSKLASPDADVAAGDVVTYTYRVDNTGDVTLNASVTDIHNGDDDLSAITPATASIAPGDFAEFTATYTVVQSDVDKNAPITNDATASFTPERGTLADLEDDASVGVAAEPAAEFTKTADVTSELTTGDIVTYTYTFTNTGNVALENLSIADDHSGLGTLSEITPSSVASLAAGDSQEFTATYETTLDDFEAGTDIPNTATASFTPERGTLDPLIADASVSIAAPAPSAVLTKTADVTSGVEADDTVTYTYNVINDGDVTLTDVSISDVHSGLGTLSAITPASVASLAIGDDIDFTATYIVTQDDIDAATNITNEATLVATPARGSLPTITDDAVVELDPPLPVMTLEKTADIIADVEVDDVITYTYVAVNTGNVTMSAVSITDAHSGLGTLSAITPASAILAPGGTQTFTATYTVTQDDIDAGTPITNEATLNGTPASGTYTPAEDDAVVTVEASTPAMTLEKTADQTTGLTVGETITYTYTVENTGNITFDFVNVTDVHNGVGLLSNIAPGSVNNFAPGDIATFTATYLILQGDLDTGAPITNEATLDGNPRLGDFTPVTDTESVDLVAPIAQLELEKTASQTANAAVDDVINYTYEVENTGNVTMQNVSITDAHSGLGALSAITPANISTLAPGATASFTASYTVTQADIDAGTDITNVATANATPLAGTYTPVTDDAVVELTPATPAIDFEKVADVTTGLAVDDIVTYTYTAENTGNVTITNLSVSDVHEGTGTLSAITPASVANLAVGQTVSFTASYQITQADIDAGTDIDNVATLAATPVLGTLPQPITDDESVALVAQVEALTLDKRALTTDFTAVDDVLSYEYDVVNTGNVTVTNLVVTDDLIETVTCPVIILAPGETTTCTADYNVMQDDLNAGSVTNHASVIGDTPSGELAPAIDNATVEGTQSPELTLVKVALDTNFAAVGDPLNYEYTVTNIGNVEITDLEVSDDRISTVVCPVTVLAPTDSTVCEAVYSVTQDDLDAGAVTNIASADGTPAGGTLTPPEDTVTVNGTQSPALGIVKTALDTSFAAVDDVLSYEYEVTNTGNVTIIDPITVSDDRIASVTCPVLPAGGLGVTESITCTASYTVTQADLDAGDVTNIASATDGNVTSPTDTAVANAVQTPSMTLVKTANETSFAAAEDVLTYNYTVTNTGNVRIGDLAVTDDLIENVSCNVAAVGNGDAFLDPNEVVVCTASYSVTQDDLNAGSVTNNAAADGTPAGGTLAPATDDETVDAEQLPALTLEKTANETSFAAVDDVLTYDYLVENTGNVEITNISVSDDRIETITCPETVLMPGESVTCTGSDIVSQDDLDAGSVVNNALATGDPVGGTLVDAPAQATVPAVQTPALNVVKNATVVNFELPNDISSYEYIVTNTGNVTLTEPIRVMDNLISDVTCPDLPTGGLAPNASITCTADYVVTQADLDAGSVTNLAFATDDTTTSPQTSATIPADQNPAMSITKSSTTTEITTLGQVVTYSFTVRNDGNLTLTGGIDVVDNKIGTINCASGNLVPDASVTCTADYLVTQADLDAGFVTNEAFSQNGSLVSAPVDLTIDANQNPSIDFAKTALTADFTNVGDVLNYEFRFENTGNVTLTNVGVSDPLISAISCPANTLAPTDVMVCTGSYSVRQSDVDAGEVVNNATASATPPNGAPLTPNDTATVETDPNPSFTFEKRATRSDFTAVGDILTYEFDVVNNGSVTLNNIAITDDLIPTVSCPATTLAPAATMVCTANYSVTQDDIDAGEVINNANVSADPADGSPLADIPSQAIVDANQTPSLSFDKRAITADFAAVNDVLSYEYEVTNTGNVMISGIVVTDDLIANVSCPVTTLAPAQSTICLADYTVTQDDIDAGSVTNIASADGNPAGGILTPPTDSVTVDAVQTPSMTIVKTALNTTFTNVGEALDYQYVVTNTGNVTITNSITVTDDRIASVSCPALPPAGLAPTATLTCSATYLVTQADIDAGEVTNIASASDGTTTSNTDDATVDAVQAPSMVMTKVASPQVFASVGQTINYDYVITNTGNVTITDPIEVTDNRIASVNCPVLPIGGLVPGETLTCTGSDVVMQADIDAGAIENIASATDGNITTPDVTENINANQQPALELVKAALDTSFAAVDDLIDYTYVVTNSGNVTITDAITVADDRIASVSCPALPGGTLIPGDSLTCTASYSVTQDDLDAGSVTNIARASTPDTTSAPDTVTVNADQLPALSIVKTPLQSSFDTVGDVLTYEYMVRNTGNVTLIGNVSVSDDRISSVACPAIPASGFVPNSTVTCTASYVVTQADIDAGQVTNIASASNGDLTSPTDTVTVNADQNPELDIVKSSVETTYSTPGDVINYEYTVINSGNTTIIDAVSVQDNRIDNVTCPALPAGGLAPGGQIICTGSDVATQADIDAGVIENLANATDGTTSSPIATRRVFATRNSSLDIEKNATVINFALPGDIVTYEYIVTNTGNVTITDPITVDDNLIASVVCPALPAEGLLPSAQITCSADYSVTLDNLEIGVVLNVATASAGGVTSAPTSEIIPDGANPAIEVRKSTTLTSFNAVGDVLTYEFEIENTGNVTLVGPIEVVDNRIGTFVCFAGPTFIAGQVERCTRTDSATQADLDAGFVTNDAFAMHPRTSSPPVFVTIPAEQNPELGLVKTALDTSFTAVGDRIDYEYLVTNTGNVTLLKDITVTDNRIASVSCPALPAGGLAPNSSITCTASDFVTQADIDAGDIVNIASASDGTITSPSVDEEVEAVQTAQLSLNKLAQNSDFDTFGETLSYNYIVTNTGNVTITDSIDVNDDRIDTVNCPALPAAGLLPGGSITCTATDNVTQDDLDAGFVTNTATASAGAITSDPSSQTVTGTQISGLEIVKRSDDTSFTAVNDVLTYNYDVTNTGNVTITSAITVTDDRIENVSCPALPAGGLSPAETLTCSASYDVTQDDIDLGFVTNIASATDDTTTSDDVSLRIDATQTPALRLEKTALTSTFEARGDILSYEYIVTNDGNVTLTEEITVTDDQIAVVNCPALPAGGLPPNASITCTATDTVTQADIDLGSVTNIARASDGITSSEPVEAVVNGSQTSALEIDKLALTSSFANVGDELTYNYIVRNAGNVTIINPIEISDDRILEVDCPALPAGGLVPGGIVTCTAVDLVTQDDLDLGSVTNIASASAGTITSETDSVTIEASQTPALAIVKTSPDETFTALRQILTYNYEVTNTGNVTITEPITVADDRIETVTCPTLPDAGLSPTESISCTAEYEVTQDDLNAGFVTNIASASDGTTTSDETSLTIEGTSLPALEVVKVALTDSFAMPEDIISYEYTVTNTGNVTLTDPIRVSDDKIETVTCPELPDTGLAPTLNIVCVADYAVTQADIDAGFVTNLASAQSGDTLSEEVSETVQAQRLPALELRKTASTPVQTFGPLFEVAYEIAVENTGNVTLTDLSLEDNLSEALAPATLFGTPQISAAGFTSGAANDNYNGVDNTQLLGDGASLAVGETGIVTILLTADITEGGPAQGNTAVANAAETEAPAPSNDPSVTPNEGEDINPTPLTILDADGDGSPDNFESSVDDRDGDGIPDSEDYDPTGYFYCEENGQILTGGGITVTGPLGSNSSIGAANNIVIVEDGSNGFYQFYVTAPGEYSLTPTYPTSGEPSEDLLASTDVLDVTTLLPANPALLGGTELGDSGELSDFTPEGNSPFYTSFDFESGDPAVFANNLPMQHCGESSIQLDKRIVGNAELTDDGRQQVTYEFIVTNTGETRLDNIQVSDNLGAVFGPDNVTVDSLTTVVTPLSSLNGQGVLPLVQVNSAFNGVSSIDMLTGRDSLEAGASVSVELVTLLTPASDGEVTNIATVTASAPLDGSILTGDGAAAVELQALSDPSFIRVEKRAQPRTVQIGDPVLYTIDVTNDSPSRMTDLQITDRIPAGFAYIPGSAVISDASDSVAIEPIVTNRGVLSWDILQTAAAPLDALNAGETVSVSLRLLAGPNVEFGAHENQAFVDSLRTGQRSETATAIVDYIPEPSFDCTPVLGRVYDDVNHNGYPDDGEPGLPGVQLATVNGDIITTDQYGRYHIPCAAIADRERGSNFLLKANVRTLPLGYHTTSENPRVVRATRGKFVKMNFGAAHRPKLRIDLFAADFDDNTGALSTEASQRIRSVLGEGLQSDRAILVYHADDLEHVDTAQAHLKLALDVVKNAAPKQFRDIAMEASWGDAAEFIAPSADTVENLSIGSLYDRPAVDTPRDRVAFTQGENGQVRRFEDSDEIHDTSFGSGTSFSSDADNDEAFADAGEGGLRHQAGSEPLTSDSRVGRTEPFIGRRDQGTDESKRPGRLQRWVGWGNKTTSYAEGLEIETTVDALNPVKRLNAQANVVSHIDGRDIKVEAYNNYDAFIDRLELRLFPATRSVRGEPVAIIPITGRYGQIPVSGDMSGQYNYVLRAYGKDGDFDETGFKALTIGEPEYDLSLEDWAYQSSTAFGQNTITKDNIRIRGGAVRVYGRNVPGETVMVMGQQIAVDAQGLFIAEQLLPTGEQSVDVRITGLEGNENRILRTVDVKARDTFYAAQIEATIGQDATTDGDSFEEGRVAFYVRSRLNDRWSVTATADTGEAEIENLLSGLDDKDLGQLLRRLDPDRFYPTYGDDSVIEQDAPTSGRFYLRVERDDDYALWGNYQTNFNDTEFGRVQRTLYGAKLHWDENGHSTKFGDDRTRLTAFIAEGGSRQGRDEFRGTGGSVYYLRQGDISIGSEILRIQTQDSVSGLVIESRRLIYGTDYDLDFIQGRIILNQPLGSTSDDGRLFRDGSQGGNEQILVVDYEFSPLLGSDDGAAVYGARGSRWFGDHVKLGATYNHDTDGGQESDLYGLDLTLQYAAGTYIKGEVARSEGQGVETFRSIDGGFTFNPQDRGGLADPTAQADAYALEAAVDFSEIDGFDLQGTSYAYWRKREAGFSGFAESTNQTIEQFGGGLNLGLSRGLTFSARADITEDRDVGTNSFAEGRFDYELDEKVTASIGASFTDDARGNAGTSLGGRVDYKINDDNKVYAFGQVGIQGENTRTTDRIGAGAEIRLSQKIYGGGEISTGEDGLGARASLRYQYEDGDEYYVAYDLPLRARPTGNLGSFNLGARRRYGDALSVFGEERLQFNDRGLNGITHAYGVNYTPGDWNFGLSGETGQVDNLDRDAISASIGFAADRFKAGLSAEWRQDEDVDTQDSRTTWLLRSTALYQASEELRLQGKLNIAFSDQARTGDLGPESFNEAEFTEGSIAAAYRPIWDDRFNLIGKFVWLDDLSPSSQQFNGEALNFRQRSRIVSLDASYDIAQKWTLGGKYAYRAGSVTSSRDSLDFTGSEAELGVVRLDYHLTNRWDALIEGRYLDIGNGVTSRIGGQVGLFRHVNDNAKIGVGLTYGGIEEEYLATIGRDDNIGWYLNVVGKF